ncbi:HAD-IIA family hydrolase [Nakamurella aerolata]|uniref:HAD-IIA family hydrolase n=1 Tax=Nakamurella aerolata TaxID=1656892 RepID=A0A849A841_9ACTN|nr:HAD-IIA family hydrolase [Nakamurella aerolata]
MTAPLSRQFDVALLDLDGTVYLGHTVIPGVPTALEAAKADGMRAVFVTNNASRPPQVVAEALTDMGVPAAADEVFTSPQAAADLLAASHPAGAKVLVVGADYLAEAVAAVGLSPVALFTDQPVAVVQGHSPETGWPQLAEACLALRAGADWVACNTDVTLPTDRGLLPGNGAMVAALQAATGLRPWVAGKPGRALLDAAVQRTSAERPLVVGDRLDTDIEAGVTAGLPTLMVLTGVNTAADVLAAPPSRRPQWLAKNLAGLTDPQQVVRLDTPAIDGATGWTVTGSGDQLELHGSSAPATGDQRSGKQAGDQADQRPGKREGEQAGDQAGQQAGEQTSEQLAAFAALAAAVWSRAEGEPVPAIRPGDEAARRALAGLGFPASG